MTFAETLPNPDAPRPQDALEDVSSEHFEIALLLTQPASAAEPHLLIAVDGAGNLALLEVAGKHKELVGPRIDIAAAGQLARRVLDGGVPATADALFRLALATLALGATVSTEDGSLAVWRGQEAVS